MKKNIGDWGGFEWEEGYKSEICAKKIRIYAKMRNLRFFRKKKKGF